MKTKLINILNTIIAMAIMQVIFLGCSQSPPLMINGVQLDDMQPIFNGKDLAGWTGNLDGYPVINGAITCKDGGNIYTKQTYADFVLAFDFQLTSGANNGLGIRAPLQGDAAYLGMELQVLDNSAAKYAKLKAWQYHGSIYGIVAAKKGSLKPVGQWNHQVVIANGRHIQVILNGTTIIDANLDVATTPKAVDNKNHPGAQRAFGHIGFLGHGSVVAYKNIKIKMLNTIK